MITFDKETWREVVQDKKNAGVSREEVVDQVHHLFRTLKVIDLDEAIEAAGIIADIYFAE